MPVSGAHVPLIFLLERLLRFLRLSIMTRLLMQIHMAPRDLSITVLRLRLKNLRKYSRRRLPLMEITLATRFLHLKFQALPLSIAIQQPTRILQFHSRFRLKSRRHRTLFSHFTMILRIMSITRLLVGRIAFRLFLIRQTVNTKPLSIQTLMRFIITWFLPQANRQPRQFGQVAPLLLLTCRQIQTFGSATHQTLHFLPIGRNRRCLVLTTL